MTTINSDYLAPAKASLRLSDMERGDAVIELERNATAGRLTAVELTERRDQANRAVVRGDLAPIFADLPAAAPLTDPMGARWDPRTLADSAPDRPKRLAALLTALSPFAAVGLFFLTGPLGGFAYAWLWFLLIPVTAIVLFVGRPGQR